MKIFKSILIIFSILFSSLNGYSQWNNIGVPYGYDFESAFIDQQGEIFLRTTTDILYSDDFGQSWNETGINKTVYPWNFQIIEIENHNIMLKLENEVYQFDKLSKSWDFIDSAKYPLLNIDHHGYFWCRKGNPLENGLYLSKDMGVSYIFYKTSENDSYEHSYGYSYKDQFSIVVGTGHNQPVSILFRITDTADIVPLIAINHFSYLNYKTGTIFIDDHNGEFKRSTDAGVTFNPIELPNSNLNILNYDANIILLKDDRLQLQNNGKVYVSSDDGITWINISDNYLDGPRPDLFPPAAVSIINYGDSIVAVSAACYNQGVFLSANNATSWNFTGDNLFNPVFDKLVEDKEGNLYAKTCSDTTFLISKDAGVSWSKFLIDFENKQYGLIDIGLNSNGDIFAVTNWALFKSVDQGASFQILSNVSYFFYNNMNSARIVVAPSKYLYLYSSTTGSSLFSDDNGEKWIYAPMYLPAIIKTIDENGHLYFVTTANYYGLIKYNPYTQENKLVSYFKSFTYSFRHFEPLRNGLIFFSTYENQKTSIWLSKDDMETIEEVPAALPVEPLNYFQAPMFSDSNNNIYILRDDGIYISIDEGQNFDYFSPYPSLNTDYAYYKSSFENLYAYIGGKPPLIYRLGKSLLVGDLVKGTVFLDHNSNCLYDTLENVNIANSIKIAGSSNLTLFSNANGNYKLRLSTGNYDLYATPLNPLWESCPVQNVSIDLNTIDTVPVNLGIKPVKQCPYLSVNLQIPTMRRCFDGSMFIKYCNEGTVSAFNTTLEVNLNENMTYLSSSITPLSQVGKTLIFDLGELASMGCGDLVIHYNLSCTVKLNEEVCTVVNIKPVDQCSNNLPQLSQSEKCLVATGSFDPNDKTAFINGKPANGNTKMNEDIEYLIRFQNTGTDTAFRVVVKDILPKGFDMSTLRILNSSHPFTFELQNPGILKFIFDPIMLPDSNINEVASHGFIAFKISPKPDLDYGTKLDNYADIFFDFNDPVRTDTAMLTVTQTTSLNNYYNSLNFSYYPNPVHNELNLSIKDIGKGSYTVSIIDILGKELYRDTRVTTEDIHLQNLKLVPGIYFIDLKDDKGKQGFGKFVVD